MLTHEYLLQRVWGPGHPGHGGPVRTVVKNIRRKLGDDAEDPSYVFTETSRGLLDAEGRSTGTRGGVDQGAPQPLAFLGPGALRSLGRGLQSAQGCVERGGVF